jgi:phosphoglycolate phosphatase-like HAD superfamily hydrolase
MRPLVFDLDLTLIRDQRRDLALWIGAINAALGTDLGPDHDWSPYPVHTDHGLLQALSRTHRGRDFTAEERVGFEALVVSRLDAALVQTPDIFETIAGARALLSAVEGRAVIATGNIHPVTVRKLRASGLDHVRLPCSCSADGLDRAGLVRRGLERLGWRPGDPATSFGDGTWDLRAARALGVGFVGIAADDAHEEHLRGAGARHVVRDYTDLDSILELAERAETPGEA